MYFVELHWSSYLSGRFQQVVIDGATSDKYDIDFGLPQGSCIGLSLFSIYAGQLFDIVTQHLPTVHCYADDTKLYLAFRQGDRATEYSAVAAVEACIQDVREWVIKDMLKIKDDKSEFILIGTQAQLNTERAYKRSAVCTLLASFAPIMAAFCNGHYRYKSSAKSLVVCFQEMIH